MQTYRGRVGIQNLACYNNSFKKISVKKKHSICTCIVHAKCIHCRTSMRLNGHKTRKVDGLHGILTSGLLDHGWLMGCLHEKSLTRLNVAEKAGTYFRCQEKPENRDILRSLHDRRLTCAPRLEPFAEIKPAHGATTVSSLTQVLVFLVGMSVQNHDMQMSSAIVIQAHEHEPRRRHVSALQSSQKYSYAFSVEQSRGSARPQ